MRLYVEPASLMRGSVPSMDAGAPQLPLPRSPIRGGGGYRGPATESSPPSRRPQKGNVNIQVPRIDATVVEETLAALSMRRLRSPFLEISHDGGGREKAHISSDSPGAVQLYGLRSRGFPFDWFPMRLKNTDIVEGKVPGGVIGTCRAVFGIRNLSPP